MSSDDELVDRVAHVWIECGGDAEGIEHLWRGIRDRIQELEEQP